jgi:hypothetical protein
MAVSTYGARWNPTARRWDFVAPYAPPVIGYKYRRFDDDNGLRILRDRAIWYASPETLNDPLDCRIDVRSHFDQLLAVHQEGTRVGALLRAISSATVTRVHGGVRVSMLQSFNDTLNEAGIFCLSGTATEPLMWAHYGQGHRGFCIGFHRWYIEWLRTQLANHQIAGFGPVNYVSAPDLTHAFLEHLPRLRNFETQAEMAEWIKDYAQSVIVEVLSTKSKSWRYEKEYRSIRTSPGAVPVPPSAIAEIVFGAHSAPADEDKIRQILSGSEWNHVQFRKTSFSPLHFLLSLKDL